MCVERLVERRQQIFSIVFHPHFRLVFLLRYLEDRSLRLLDTDIPNHFVKSRKTLLQLNLQPLSRDRILTNEYAVSSIRSEVPGRLKQEFRGQWHPLPIFPAIALELKDRAAGLEMCRLECNQTRSRKLCQPHNGMNTSCRADPY
jgi:hypothetical protein